MTGNQSSMIAELQDLYREWTNFSTGVNRQSFTDSGGAALVYTSREFELISLIYFGCLELKVWVTALQKHPENRAASGGQFLAGSWSLSSAPQLHSMTTQQEEQEKHWPFSFRFGDFFISIICPISFHEFFGSDDHPKD